jgi:hypothetical protein
LKLVDLTSCGFGVFPWREEQFLECFSYFRASILDEREQELRSIADVELDIALAYPEEIQRHSDCASTASIFAATVSAWSLTSPVSAAKFCATYRNSCGPMAE